MNIYIYVKMYAFLTKTVLLLFFYHYIEYFFKST